VAWSQGYAYARNRIIIVVHTWMYRRNEKSHFSLRSNERAHFSQLYVDYCKNKLAACLMYNIDIAVFSECLCHLKAQYLVQSPNICSGQGFFKAF